jgi:hypothetical protein
MHTTRKLALVTFAASLSAIGLACILLVVGPRRDLDSLVAAVGVGLLIAAAGYWGFAVIEERHRRREAMLWQASLDLVLRSVDHASGDVDDWHPSRLPDDCPDDMPGLAADDSFGRAYGRPRPGSARARRRDPPDSLDSDPTRRHEVWVWRNGRWQRRIT